MAEGEDCSGGGLEGAGVYDLKPRGYRVRVEETSVVVEHRASFRPITWSLLLTGYGIYLCLPAVRTTVHDFLQSHDPIMGAFAAFFLILPWFASISWLAFKSGEMMRCDPKELQYAYRRSLGGWKRRTFATSQIRQMQKAARGGGKSRIYWVLNFHVDGKSVELLEDLPLADMNRILVTCKAMGVDAVVEFDDAAEMNRDIARRGWFMNPWRPDEVEAHPKEQQ